MPSSRLNHRSMAPAPSHARTGSVSPTGSSSIASSATAVGGGSEKRSRSSGPAVTSRWRAASATVVVSSPHTAVSDPVGPGWGMRPWLGLNPTRPQNAAGIRVGPPPSLAVATGTRPAATAAALPPLDPPGVRSGSQGLRAAPNTLVLVKLRVPNSGAAVLPTGTAPAARRRATWTESAATGPRPAYARDPWGVGMPAQSSRSLTPSGTPANRPGSRPTATAASTASAAARAPASSTCTKAPSRSLPASIAASAWSSTSLARRWPVRTASAISMAATSKPDPMVPPDEPRLHDECKHPSTHGGCRHHRSDHIARRAPRLRAAPAFRAHVGATARRAGLRPPISLKDRGHLMERGLLTIGAVSERTGVASSALRFYESEGLVHATRSSGGQRRYAREVVRRVSFIRVAQQVGLRLDEIRDALASLPDNRTPTAKDWERLATSWRPRIDAQIHMLERLRDRLAGCIGCGCLSLGYCKILNPGDEAGLRGPGPRYILDDD